jgi:hypothetical protein
MATYPLLALAPSSSRSVQAATPALEPAHVSPMTEENQERPVPYRCEVHQDVLVLVGILESKVEALRAVIELTASHAEALDRERFSSIDCRFEERGRRFDQASKETADSIARVEGTFSTQIKALLTRVSELKDRIGTVEGQHKGETNVIGWIIGSAGAMVAALAIIISIVHYLPQGGQH